MAWMRDTRIRIFMQMELDNRKKELVWLIICHNCSVDICPEGQYPPRSLQLLPIISRTCREIGKGNEGHLATCSKDDSQDVISTTSTSSARSSTTAENYTVLAITSDVN